MSASGFLFDSSGERNVLDGRALLRFSYSWSGRPSGRPSDGLKAVAYIDGETV
jgi:hypothetical protein